MFRLFMLGSVVMITALIVILVSLGSDHPLPYAMAPASSQEGAAEPVIALPVPRDQVWYSIEEIGLQFQLEQSMANRLGYEISGKGKATTAHFFMKTTTHPDSGCWSQPGSLGSIHAIDIGDQEEAAYYTLLKKVEIGDQYFVYNKADDPCPVSSNDKLFQGQDPHQLLNDAFDATARPVK